MIGGREAPRRRAPRVAIRLEGSLLGRASRGVTVVDLSLTGCLVRCDALLEPGAIFDLSLRLGDEPFAAKVRVAEASLDGASPAEETRRYFAGLHFLSLPAQEEARLRAFLEERRRHGSPTP
jgi:hypothetical protein